MCLVAADRSVRSGDGSAEKPFGLFCLLRPGFGLRGPLHPLVAGSSPVARDSLLFFIKLKPESQETFVPWEGPNSPLVTARRVSGSCPESCPRPHLITGPGTAPLAVFEAISRCVAGLDDR